MGYNPLVDKINKVVRVLTHGVRLDTVTRMVETGRGMELYEAHEKIYRMLLNRDENNINELIKGTYFQE